MNEAEVFFEKLVQGIAKEVVKSNILQAEVAKAVQENTVLVNKMLENLNPDTIGLELARHIIRQENAGGFNAHSHAIYAKVMSDAKERASQIVAENIAGSTLNA